MFVLVTICSLIIFHFRDSTSLISECETTASIWTYYPCSFIISSSSSPVSCRQASITLSIDQCMNREIMFFWHFPSGNLTITLESDRKQSFLLRLFKISILKRRLINHIYHLVTNRTIENQILDEHDQEEITIPSNEYYQCSIKFETSNQIIFDYGTFLQMTVLTNDNNID